MLDSLTLHWIDIANAKIDFSSQESLLHKFYSAYLAYFNLCDHSEATVTFGKND